jgi:hypothetical protein
VTGARVTVYELHQLIDPMWESGLVTRAAAYAMCAAHLGLTIERMHMGQLSQAERLRVVEFVRAFRGAHGVFRTKYAGGVRDVHAPLQATLGQHLLAQETQASQKRRA